MEIKRGDLVKAWDDDVGSFVVGEFVEMCHDGFYVVNDMNLSTYYKNAVKIPDELAKQLEKLGM